MNVIKLVTQGGETFYSDNVGNGVIHRAAERRPDYRVISIVDMPEKAYQAIPVTAESLRIFQ